VVAALTGVPAGRVVDRFGSQRMTVAGLIGMAAGCFVLSMMPAAFGITGYVAPIVVVTAGYALFQAANNTAVMTNIPPDRRGVVSGMLNLSRNLGLITGASVMGAVFALASATSDVALARPDAVAAGMRITFAVAGMLSVAALAIAATSARRQHVPRSREGTVLHTIHLAKGAGEAPAGDNSRELGASEVARDASP
jgi:MFS family permease